MTAVDARLVREDALGDPQPWVLVDDPANTDTGLSDPVADYEARTTLAAILAALADKLTEGGTVALDAPTLAALEAVTATISNFPGDYPDTTSSTLLAAIGTLLSGGITVNDGHPNPQTDALTDTQLRDTPVPTQDAAEDTAVTWQTINFATSGAHTIVTVAPGQRLRLRRFLPTTGSVPDATGDPVLTLTLGGQSLRSQALIGRFDIPGDDGEDLVITSSKAAQVDGTVGYIIE